MNNYKKFLKKLDARLENYFKEQAEFICCKEGCSACCEKGDYPISELELHYLMQGYAEADYDTKINIQKNIVNITKGGKCPFLLNKKCSLYRFRPIICRVHGLAYLCNDNVVKLPHCANEGKNFENVYKDGIFSSKPILENLNTPNLLKDLEYGEIHNLYDWLKKT